MIKNLLISFTDPKLLVPVIIGVVAVIVLIVFFAAISKRRKKSPADETSEDRELVATNAKSVEVLIALSEGNDEVVSQLKELEEKLKYLIPSEEKKVYDADKKIRGLLGDLKILLSKGKDKDDSETLAAIKEIKVAMAERNVNVGI